MKRLLNGTLCLKNSPTGEQIQNGRTTDEIPRDPITPWCGPPLFSPCFPFQKLLFWKFRNFHLRNNALVFLLYFKWTWAHLWQHIGIQFSVKKTCKLSQPFWNLISSLNVYLIYRDTDCFGAFWFRKILLCVRKLLRLQVYTTRTIYKKSDNLHAMKAEFQWPLISIYWTVKLNSYGSLWTSLILELVLWHFIPYNFAHRNEIIRVPLHSLLNM